MSTTPLTHFLRFPIDKLVATDGYVTGDACDLENDVHPLFTPQNMRGFDYDAILPALRLASYFLTTDSIMGYWWAIFWSDPFSKKLEKRPGCSCGGDADEYHLALSLPTKDVTAEELAWVKLDLVSMAHFVHFARLKIDTNALCRMGESISYDKFEGNASTIFVGEGLEYPELLRLRKLSDEKGRGFSDDLFRRYFRFAVVLVHELAHAAQFARFGLTRPFFVGDGRMAEAGYDWEHSVFGGLVARPGDVAVVEEWPSSMTYEDYRASGSSVRLCGELASNTTREWRVPDTWVRQLFQKRFWDLRVPRLGAAALRPPKIMGMRYTRYDCHCKACRLRDAEDDRVAKGKAFQSKVDQAIAELGNESTAPALAVTLDGLHLDDEVKPETCVAGHTWRRAPSSYPNDPDLTEGLPEGYVMFGDGTFVLSKFRKSFKERQTWSKK